ncbi:hypothetical protein PCANC_00780 [Puccinia coronata f. sp. avenae]|uniref:C2H2-type domain-containing protein n=1 Tax=Puccinia coronata f. sp. avenae TaxID=200324 RepID=A0A2N5W7R7_9BASI|nr:hypothetical protein PCANC_00780 [Puccinia coronata f. sp. avenae]
MRPSDASVACQSPGRAWDLTSALAPRSILVRACDGPGPIMASVAPSTPAPKAMCCPSTPASTAGGLDMDDPNFELVDRGTHTYRCLICPHARVLNDVAKHRRRPVHILNVRQLASANVNAGPPRPPSPTSREQQAREEIRVGEEQDAAHAEQVWATMDALYDRQEHGQIPAVIPRTLEEELDEHDPIIAGPDDLPPLERLLQEDDWQQILEDELEALHGDNEQPAPGGDAHDPGREKIGRGVPVPTDHWYPFKSKMEVIGSLIMGHTHSMISRSLYSKIRGILALCDINLPAWATVQASRTRIRKLLGNRINYCSSPFDTPTFSLDPQTLVAMDLANPLIANDLDFYPESSNGAPVYKFSQSHKWLKCLSPSHRAQMCEVRGKHFYIFEPVQLVSNRVVIPIFLFMLDSRLTARCVDLNSSMMSCEGTRVIITLPKAIPFDDPILSSVDVQEFQSIYSEILLADGRCLNNACGASIVQTDGHALNDVVTLVPNPWRLKAKGKIIRHVPITLYADDTSGNLSKQFNKHISFFFTLSGLPPHLSNQEYNCHFLATSNVASVLEVAEPLVDGFNHMALEGFSAWDCSISQTVLVNSVVLCFLADSPMHAEVTNTPNPGQSNHPCRMCKLSVEYKSEMKSLAYIQQFLHLDEAGNESPNPPRSWATTIKDSMRLYDIFMEHNITQFRTQSQILGVKDSINTRFVEESRGDNAVKAKMAALDLNYPTRLYNPFLRLEGFDGALDAPVETLHVVLLGIVKYLARDDISSLKAKDKITLAARLDSFNSTSLNLCSFRESIRRFGPASLFATEKFESYNGVLRQASIHSNRLAPSRDLATTFDNFSSLKFLVSGGVIHHDGNNSTSTASKNVQDIFLGNPGRPRGSKDPAIPPELLASAPCSSILEVTELQIAKHDHLRKGVYVVVRVMTPCTDTVVGLVESLWARKRSHRTDYFVKVQGFTLGEIDQAYQMRSLRKTNHHSVIHIEKVAGTINVQHNCRKFNCPIKKTRQGQVERQDLKVLRPQVCHADNDHFIINSASLSNVELHHSIASLPTVPVSPMDWLQCVRDGYANWLYTPNHNANDILEEDEDDQSGDDAAEGDAEEEDAADDDID